MYINSHGCFNINSDLLKPVENISFRNSEELRPLEFKVLCIAHNTNVGSHKDRSDGFYLHSKYIFDFIHLPFYKYIK